MTATLQIAKIIDILSMSGEVMERDELMRKIGVKNYGTFQAYLNMAREEIGIYTITKPNGYIGYKINYGDCYEGK